MSNLDQAISRPKKTIRILSIDGGGIRGLIPLRYLAEIEKRNDGKPIHTMFDYIGGTSTGGLIAALLTVPGKERKVMTAQEAFDFYKKHGPKIFNPWPRVISNIYWSSALAGLFPLGSLLGYSCWNSSKRLGLHLFGAIGVWLFFKKKYWQLKSWLNISLRCFLCLICISFGFDLYTNCFMPDHRTFSYFSFYLLSSVANVVMIDLAHSTSKDYTSKVSLPEKALRWFVGIAAVPIIANFLSDMKTQINDWQKYFSHKGVAITAGLILAVYMYRCKTMPKYLSSGLKDAYHQHFGEDARLWNANTGLGILATDTRYKESFLFNNVRANKFREEDILHGAPLLDIILSTSAAPTYFHPIHFRNENRNWRSDNWQSETAPWDSLKSPVYNWRRKIFEDGGTTSNNPAEELIRLACLDEKNKDSDLEIKLLSLSTGRIGTKEDPTRDPAPSSWYSMWYANYPHGGLDNVIYERLIKFPEEINIRAFDVHRRMKNKFNGEGLKYGYMRPEFKVKKELIDNMDRCGKDDMKSLEEAAVREINTPYFSEVLALLKESQPDQGGSSGN